MVQIYVVVVVVVVVIERTCIRAVLQITKMVIAYRIHKRYIRINTQLFDL